MEISLQKLLSDFIEKKRIPVVLLKVAVGKVSPPAKVIEATVETASQKQMVKTQTERVKAERARELAEKASAKADKAYKTEFGMTSQQYLEMKKLENERFMLEMVKNKNNVQVFLGASPQPIVASK